MNTIQQAYNLRGFVLGCEMFAERQECPDRFDIVRGAKYVTLWRRQVWYPDLCCAVTVYHAACTELDVVAVLATFAEVWRALRGNGPNTRASWAPGIFPAERESPPAPAPRTVIL